MFSNGYELNQRVSSSMSGVYGWMGGALIITAVVSYYVAHTPAFFMYVHTHQGIMAGLLIAQFALVISITFFINRVSFVVALILFLLYAASLGVTLSSIFYLYTKISIITTFLTTAGMFGVMSLYGYITKTDLTSMGNVLFMLLIGLIIGLVINIFLKNERLDYIFSGIGVVLFVLLTAFDTQKIKQYIRSMLINEEMMQKVTLLGALILYLDFINIFLFLLRFLGNRREQ